MQRQIRETSLSHVLLEGEELIWSGRPIERRNRGASAVKICIALGLTLMCAAIIVEILVGDLQAGRASFLLLPGFILCIIGVVCYLISKIDHFLLQFITYAITNQRVIILQNGPSLRIVSFEKRAITQVQCIEHPDGSGDLVFYEMPVYGSFVKSHYAFRTVPNVRLVERKLLSEWTGKRRVKPCSST